MIVKCQFVIDKSEIPSYTLNRWVVTPICLTLRLEVIMSGKEVAIEIRKELKQKYPKTKFSVVSDYNSVTINYNFGVSPKEIETLCSKYEMGHFDGMDDMYHNDNRNDSIPQCKYIFVNRNRTWDVKKKVVEYICKKFNLELNDRYEIDGYRYLSVIRDIEIMENEDPEITFKRIEDEAVKQHLLFRYETENVTESKPEDIIVNVTESATENTIESVTQEVVIENTIENTTQDVIENTIENTTQDVIENTIENTTQDVIKNKYFSGIPNLRGIRTKVVIPENEFNEITKIKSDVIYFTENYIPQIKLTEIQKEKLKFVVNNLKCELNLDATDNIIMNIAIVWYVITNHDKNVGIVTVDITESKSVISQIKSIYNNLPIWLQVPVEEWNKKTIVLTNGSHILADSISGNSFLGYCINFLYVDYTSVESEVWDDFIDSVLPTVYATPKSRVVLCNSPKMNNSELKSFVTQDVIISKIENVTKIEIIKSDTQSYRDVLLKKLEEIKDADSEYYYDIICYSKGGRIIKSDDPFEACYNIMHFFNLIEFNDDKYLLSGYKELYKVGVRFEKSDSLFIDTGNKKLILFKDNICYIV